jgi:hypothetical protein
LPSLDARESSARFQANTDWKETGEFTTKYQFGSLEYKAYMATAKEILTEWEQSI